MRTLFLTIFAAMALAVFASDRTTRRRLSVAPEKAPITAPCDTLTGSFTDSVRLSGFDKPLRSRKETFFATNILTDTVESMAITLTYLDALGRQFHRTHVHVPGPIPPGQTLNRAIPTWDRQQSFYYIHSETPSRSIQAAPFDVKITIDTIFVKRR